MGNGAMHHLSYFATATGAQQGPGVLLRTLVVVSVLGVAFLAWFLLRGYGSKD